MNNFKMLHTSFLRSAADMYFFNIMYKNGVFVSAESYFAHLAWNRTMSMRNGANAGHWSMKGVLLIGQSKAHSALYFRFKLKSMLHNKSDSKYKMLKRNILLSAQLGILLF